MIVFSGYMCMGILNWAISSFSQKKFKWGCHGGFGVQKVDDRGGGAAADKNIKS